MTEKIYTLVWQEGVAVNMSRRRVVLKVRNVILTGRKSRLIRIKLYRYKMCERVLP